LVAVAFAEYQVPATLEDCLAKEHNKTAEEAIKAKWEALKTCAQKCFSGAGIAPPDAAKKQCFATKKADEKSFWEGLQSSAQHEANQEKFKSCVSSTCSKTPIPQQNKTEPSGPHVYNASNPHDRRCCAAGLLCEVAKPANKPNLTEAQKTSLHTCLQACRTSEGFGAEEEGEQEQSSTPQSSQQSSDVFAWWHKKKHHHHSCLKHFCTKANFETCKPPKDPSLEAKIQAFELNEFKTTCSCLQKDGDSSAVDCTQLKDSDCTALFAKEAQKKAEEAAKHSSSA